MNDSSHVIGDAMEDSEALGLRFIPERARCVTSGGTETQGLRSSGDRTPRVSSALEWGARKETHPARGSPCATGPGSHRGTGASWGRVVTSNAQPIESVPPGALGGCFDCMWT